MLRPYDLFENILLDIESDIRNDINIDTLAEKHSLSNGHLRKIFRFAFKQTLAGYIRSRKLTASLYDLFDNEMNLLDIALLYGFGYEQSYIRAFKSEYGITPGDLRKSGKIVKVKPPLYLFDENKMNDGLFFGPDIVMVPQFHIIGKKHKIPFDDSLILAPKAAIQFWENERKQIKNVINPNVYIGFTCNIDCEAGYSEYITSVQAEKTKNIPQGLSIHTFESSLCARFRYIGQHHYYDLNRSIAKEMYSKIDKFKNDEKAKYALFSNNVYFEKVDTGQYDGNYCQMEGFTPVMEKK